MIVWFIKMKTDFTLLLMTRKNTNAVVQSPANMEICASQTMTLVGVPTTEKKDHRRMRIGYGVAQQWNWQSLSASNEMIGVMGGIAIAIDLRK